MTDFDTTQAACRNHPTDLFFPNLPRTASTLQIQQATAPAQAICATCPINQPCLQWALNHPTDAGQGIWGGHTHRQRARLRKQRRKKAA